MTISSSTRKAGPFNGNDSTTVFPFAFKVFTGGDIDVTLTSTAGVESALVVNTHYTVALNADQDDDPGGSITYPIAGSPLATGEKLTIVGDLAELQPTELTNGGGFFPKVIERALDRVVIYTQQLREQMARTLRFPVSDAALETELPVASLRANKALVFGADGSVGVSTDDFNNSATAAAASAASAAALYDLFDDRFLGSKITDPLLDNDGNALVEGTLYWNSVANEFRLYNGTSWQVVVPAGNLQKITYVAGVDYTAGVTTTLTLPTNPLTKSNLDIVFDAAWQQMTEFEVSGTTVTFDVAIPVGVAQVEISYTTPLQISEPSDGTVTDDKVADGSALAKRITEVWATDPQFGALGNTIADDTAAIQAALDFVGDNGGGRVFLPRVEGKFRITEGLKIPSYTTLEGIAPDRYPFNSSESASCLLLDFADTEQWAVEPKTTKDGLPVPYDDIISTSDTFVYTYNCCVKNLRMEAVNTVPFGAIRMHGCPGSMVENVSVTGTGAGLLVNQCYGGSYVMHNHTHYYGTIAWEDVNACAFDVYNACIQPPVAVVPAGYLLPLMDAFDGLLVGTYKLNTNDHYNRTWGVIIGGSPSISANNSVDFVSERYSGGCFQHQAYGTVFNRFYVESTVGVMEYGCVAAVSRFVINSLHAYMSGGGNVFDLGNSISARVTAIGLVDYPDYGFGPFLDSTSLLTIDGVTAQDFGPATPQFNVVHTSGSRDFAAPTFTNSWVDFAVGWECGYRLNSRTGNVELKGRMKDGVVDVAAFTLPAGYRSSTTRLFAAAGGQIVVTPAGLVIPTGLSGTNVALDGITFYAEA